MSNLNIWDKVQKTDPEYTKNFSKGGGFSGTSINATYMAKKATETFGPMGIGWGVDIEKEDYIEGHIIDEDSGQKSVIHCIRVALWFNQDGERGVVHHFGQTTFIGKNKYGPFTDEEAPKKSLTDATTKALSMLGFGSDIFMGLYDDVSYVQELSNETAIEKADSKDDEKAAQLSQYMAWREENIRLASTATNLGELQVLFKTAVRKMTRKNDNDGIKAITKAKDEAKERLENREKAA